jgi:hypothetical protein
VQVFFKTASSKRNALLAREKKHHHQPDGISTSTSDDFQSDFGFTGTFNRIRHDRFLRTKTTRNAGSD